MTAERFVGKVALVTGAGGGIGRAVTRRLVAEGATVLAVDISPQGLAETAAAAAAGEGVVSTSVVDITRPENCRAAVEACVEQFGRLDVLGNVAGVLDTEHFLDITEERYRRLMAVNIDGPVFMSQAALPHLLTTGGTIVSIASAAGLVGTAYNVIYAVSKGGVVQLTRGLAMEFAKTRVRVNAIAPGGIATPMIMGPAPREDLDGDLLAVQAGFRGLGRPEDVANLFAFLASDEAANIHGAVVTTDGGATAG